MRNHYDQNDVWRMVEKLAGDVVASFRADDALNVVGIRTRGETLAERLRARLGERGYKQIGKGILDITLYRDDLSEVGPRPMVRPTRLETDIDAAPLLLVDDVLFTGRSIRAA